MQPITDVREIARIAYGFKASKALFVALELDLFSQLCGSPRRLPDLARVTNVAENRLESLLTALAGLGLIVHHDGAYANAPATETYLVKGKPTYFGAYFELQTNEFIFPAFNELGPLIRGEGSSDKWHDYETLMRDPETAERFSRGQHAGSLGPAIMLAKQVDLSGRSALLDVAGGSGAFSITACKRYPLLTATILDFPTARPVAERFVDEAGLRARVAFREGNALTGQWPQGHDTVLMSYLFSAVAGSALPVLLGNAYAALPAGGLLVVHDFMARNDMTGPREAGLWFLTCMFNCPDAIVLTPERVERLAQQAGFEEIETRELIPGLTQVTVARKRG